ncbi:MAG: carbohydrate ABC transporter permease [Eubacteriales bacterium]
MGELLKDKNKISLIQSVALRVFLYVVLIVIALCFLVPFAFLFLGSFKTESELFRVPFQWLPDKFSLKNYTNMFDAIPFFMYFKNTMIIVFFNVIGSLLSCSLVAYGFSRLKWPGRDQLFIVVLVTMILPYQVTLIPLFLLFNKLHWVGTFLPLTVTCFFGNPVFIFLLRQFLIGIPSELTYAGRVDGASEFRIYAQVIMPIAKPALATVAIFAFMRSWNDFLGPLVFLSSDRLYTLSLAASMLRSPYDPNWDLLLPLGVVMVLPVLILFFVLQKYFIQGITMSGVKG